MSADPQRQEQMRRQRILMLILLVPWMIMLYMMNKQAKTLEAERQRQQVAQLAQTQEFRSDAPPDEQIEQLKARIAADPKAQQSELDRLHIAVIYEQDGAWREACDAYEAFAKEKRGSPYAAHASYHAARIALDRLHEEKRFVKDLKALTFDSNRAVWDHESVGDRNDKIKAAEISSRLLDTHNARDWRYRLLDFLVALFGGRSRPHYAYAMGVMLLGLIVKVLVWPLTTWGYVASKTMGVKMKLVQPIIAELKEKHKDDNLAVMRKQQELMRKYNISMKSGCLPSILQMAILIPVYQAVRLYAYPLHNGSFLWIPNLAEPDLALLIVYVIAFIASMKLQPQQASADRQQQQMQKTMMYLMPVMFFFMMRSVASAFIMYWTVFLVFSTAQSLWLAYKWKQRGGDEAVYGSLPEELRPKPERPRRSRPEAKQAQQAPSAAHRGKKSAPADREEPGPVVQRLGEEISLRDADTGARGLLARFFAPMRERVRADGSDDGDGEAIDVDFTRDDRTPSEEAEQDAAQSGGRRRRREERKAKRQAEREAGVGVEAGSDE